MIKIKYNLNFKKIRKYTYFPVAGVLFNYCFVDRSAHLYICGAHKNRAWHKAQAYYYKKFTLFFLNGNHTKSLCKLHPQQGGTLSFSERFITFKNRMSTTPLRVIILYKFLAYYYIHA